MACILSFPKEQKKGVLSVTSPEYSRLISREDSIRDAIIKLKKRYVIGLHLNWHLQTYVHDPIIDFIFSTPEDLGTNSSTYSDLCIGLDACDFPPPFFTALIPPKERPWDMLWFGRPVHFKRPHLFLDLVKILISSNENLRILMVAPIPANGQHFASDCYYTIYEDYIKTFSESQRQNFLLMAPKGFEHPYSMHTISWFFNNSKIFVHTSPSERRCRTMAYAVKSGCYCIGTADTLSILPARYRMFPFVGSYNSMSELISSTHDHLQYINNSSSKLLIKSSRHLSQCIDTTSSILQLNRRLSLIVGDIFNPIANSANLDWRLGRHIKISHEKNNIDCEPLRFFQALLHDDLIRHFSSAALDDPELALAALLQ